jgi:hypothetical protein
MKNGRDDTEYLNNTVQDISSKDDVSKLQPSVNSVNYGKVFKDHSDL